MNTSVWSRGLGTFLAITLVLLSSQRSNAADTTVNVVNFAFQPPTVTVTQGDTVTWVQKATTGHTSTGDKGEWDSGLLSLNQTFSQTFTTAGSFPYHCTPHASFMKGSVIVKGAAVNQPPTVSITSPAAGATLTDRNVTLVADASDPDGSVAQVQFFEGRTSLGTATSSPFQITVNLGAGTHNVSAQATDNQGATGGSGVVTFTISAPPPPQNNPPTVSITSPANGSTFTSTNSISIQASASDPDGSVAKVEFFDGSTSLGSATAEPFQVSATLAPGPHSLTAQATDNQGATGTSAAISIQVNPPVQNTAPSLSAPLKTADGKFQFTVTGPAGRTYDVQASSDAKTWTTIQTVPNSTAVMTITDSSPATDGQRFYRVSAK